MILFLALFVIALLAGINEIATQEPAGEDPIEIEGANEAQRIFGGVRQHRDRLGPEDADVSIQIFTDMHCAQCRDQFLATVPELVDQLVRTGRAKLHYRHYSFSRTPIQRGFLGAEAAAEQDYLWQYVYIFFASQGEAERRGVNLDFLTAIAVSISELEVEQWERDYQEGGGEDGRFTERILRWDEAARELGLRADPSAVVNGPSGTEIVQDSPDLEEILAAVERVSRAS